MKKRDEKVEKKDKEQKNEDKDVFIKDSNPNPTLPTTGAGMLIGLQVCSRLINLLIAQLQVRFTSAEAFGAVNIQLELVLGLILTFSREGFRNSLSRQSVIKGKEEEEGEEKSIKNVALLPLFLGIPLSFLVMTIYQTRLAPNELVNHQHFSVACTIFLFGALFELICEPLYILALRNVQLGPRIWAEGAALTAKGASTLISMIVLQRFGGTTSSKLNLRQSILPFAFGQFFYGAIFLLVFVIHSIKYRGFRNTLHVYILQKQSGSIKTFNGDALSLSISMTRQNAVKHILGEADKFAVAKLGSLSEQGAYALASNYGSLVARLLYQPIEESARLTFATTLGSNTIKQTKESIQNAYDLLFNLLKFYVLFALYLITFCPPFTTPLLMFIAGKRWALETSAPKILAVYGALYLPAMAFNGLLEGFLQASASPNQLARYDGVLIGASLSFVALLASLTNLPVNFSSNEPLSISSETALILASTVSTYLRAAYCFRFAKSFFSSKATAPPTTKDVDQSFSTSTEEGQLESKGKFSFVSILPHWSTTAIFFASAVILYQRAFDLSIQDWQSPLQFKVKSFVLTGVTSLIIITSLCLTSERETLIGALQAIRGRRRSR